MKKIMNYLILLLTFIFMVGCTNVEDPSNTDVETDSQEVTVDEKLSVYLYFNGEQDC
jgi:phosphatidylglycerophosphatase A